MRIDDFVNNPPLWADGVGNYPEIVLSSRVRFARNLELFKFPVKSSVKELEEIFAFLSSRISSIPVFPLSQFSLLDRKLLVERHLISDKFIKDTNGRGVGVDEGEVLSFIINEEDHLRIQSIMPGLSLELAYKKLNEVDNNFSSFLPYAFSTKFGFLTACPTNIGTGMRASVLLHLPALVHSGKIRKVLENIAQIGFIVRGFYGEGTRVEGNFFQISNQTTLGCKEEEIIDGLHKTTLQLIEYENSACDVLLKNARPQVEDKIWRAYAALKSARLLSTDEFINLSSAVRFGIWVNILKDVKIGTLNKLLIFTQPAHLQKLMGELKTPAELDMRRALYVRENL